jgi:hypothetical protein
MRMRREPPEAEPDFFSMPIVEQMKNDSERRTVGDGASASAQAALFSSGEGQYASASDATTAGLESVPAAVLQELNRRNTAHAVHYLNPQSVYTAFPPVMAVGPPLWLQSNGQVAYGSASLTTPAGRNSLGEAPGQISQPHGPVGLLPQQVPVFHPGSNFPPYSYSTVPIAFAGMPLFYGQGAPYVESLKMPFHGLNTTLHSASLPNNSAFTAAPGASQASTAKHEGKHQEQGESAVQRLHSPGDEYESSSKEGTEA